MKKVAIFLITVISLLSLTATAQRKSYFEVNAGASKFNEDKWHPGFTFGFGARPKNFCIGIGASVSTYGNANYIPVFIQVAATPKGKFAPYASFRFGQGFYKYQVGAVKTKGVLYYSGNVGFSIANKGNAKFTIAGGFNRSQFENNYVSTQGRYWIGGYQIFLSVII